MTTENTQRSSTVTPKPEGLATTMPTEREKKSVVIDEGSEMKNVL